MLLVADATQDLHRTSQRWTDAALKNAGFDGGWARLDRSYRLPPTLIPRVRLFAERFLPPRERDAPVDAQGELDLWPCRCRWIQCAGDRLAALCVQEILHASSRHDDTGSNADVVFLASSERLGERVVAILQGKNIEVVSTFDEDRQRARQKKLTFFIGDARIKATTLHSFKGWEARTLVVGVEPYRSAQNRIATYVAMTRVKRDVHGSVLVVVCSDHRLDAYGATWDGV